MYNSASMDCCFPTAWPDIRRSCDSSFIKSMTLLTGALPAQYGLHTAGLFDITTKTGAELQAGGGQIGVYGGSRQTLSGNFEFGGVTGQTEYYAIGRYLQNGLGLENPDSNINAIHDQTYLGRFFSYTSTLLDPFTRVSTVAGVSTQRYQIPNNPGQPTLSQLGTFPGMTVYGIGNYQSSNLNENQYETNAYAVAAWQRSVGDVDAQIAYVTRYSSLHYVPDVVGDLLFNGLADDVLRSSYLNGIQGDGAYRLNDMHTIRAGFYVNGEQTQIPSVNTVEAVNAAGNAIEPPFNIYDASNKFGWQLAGYAQDEIKVNPWLTLNVGARFDQIFQYVQADQLSPRFNLTYQPFWGTVFHAGYARNFTPPPQDLGRVYQEQLYNNTTNASPVTNAGSIEPERSNVVDAGFVQQLFPQCAPAGTSAMPTKAPVAAAAKCPAAEVGFDAYYKRAQNLLDDGQFGQAYVLTAFNYEKAENVGMEIKGKVTIGNFTGYTNWAIAHQVANTVTSNQSLFAPDELQYISQHWINTDHSQALSGSSGITYLWDQGLHSWLDGSKFSATMIYGSGLRSGFANTDHLSPYGQINLGIVKEFKDWGWNAQPLTVRFDVVNLADEIYQIRNGTGIGVFAPQYGPRRGYFVGLSQKF